MAIIYISVGSNINRAHHVRAAVSALKTAFGVLTLSAVYESEAVGFEGDAFYNMVVACQVDDNVQQVSEILRAIEDANGRDRKSAKFSSRTLDLDLLLYDDLVEKGACYRVPRGEILKRAFVLWPLAEIAPDLQHPVVKKTYTQLWVAFDKTQEQLKPILFDFELPIKSLDTIACDMYVDISGSDCAVPFSKLNDALAVLQAGQILLAVSKKQALQNDIPAFCRQRNLQLVEQGELSHDDKLDSMYYFLLKQQ